MASTVGVHPHLSPNMPFIVSCSTEKVDQATRKLIRSHVMRGKKTKKVKRLAIASSLSPASSAEPDKIQVNIHDVISMYSVLQPPVCLFLYPCFVNFPDEIEPRVLWEMQQVSSVAMRIIFPLLMDLGYHPKGQSWFFPTGNDAAAWHINAFAIQSFIDRVLHGRPQHKVNSVATRHYLKGLDILRQRLAGNDDKAKVSDATISVVLKLASAAGFDGDTATAKRHMQGLRKMTDMRGGLAAMSHNPKLLVEIWRCDLSIALLACSDPVFYCTPHEPVPDYPPEVFPDFGVGHGGGAYLQEDQRVIHFLHKSTAQVWLAMRKFCLLANLGTQTRMRLSPIAIYGTMRAVMYRLLRMKYEAGTLDESLRLGLLAFTHHVFLQWQDMKMPPHHPFSGIYRHYLQDYALKDTMPPHLSLWLLMIGEVSSFSLSGEWPLRDHLQTQIEKNGIRSWNDMVYVLKSSLWISILDDRSGNIIYDTISEKFRHPNEKV
ncbi:hypothetical protein PFICI_00303 [Pestalotiopsis fici W106-1]|uniref:Transcription factor domain-containing protein n=1 Tax=Pestalotiopsis fici (strain W106-1 / CGMCC3.15140) TaxID=1229662 RepID=W3XKE6_PESFW|nr:uncharacterized protein PFICI_00303 [Pestalotiopsis fici W106-1]ETS86475.1 hypothetical protein PFICI_00303 [Pestalotiopsis fici W106-1]